MSTPDPAAVPMLAVLKDRDRAKILATARQRTFAAGETVVREGDSSLNLFLVLAGTARVEREAKGVVGRLKTGDFFGEVGLIAEHARMATVTAETDLTCLLLPSWEFKALLHEHPEMAIPMLEALIARIHAQDEHQH